MTKFRVAIIGCGRPWKSPGATGFGMGHAHAAGYQASPDAEIVAAVDINAENLDAFCRRHHVPHAYRDAGEMLAQEKPDIVSICLWPHLHAPLVIQAAQAGVKAIHCEKPMATTFGDARKMVEVCESHGVVLTFNHQRRFGKPFRKAKELLDSGVIGQLQRLEAFAPNLYDWGTHWFDMLFFYNDECPAEWVIGQIDARGGYPVFGAPVEGQGLSYFKWKNGVAGLVATGYQGAPQSEPLRGVGCSNRLIGSAGMIEVRDESRIYLCNAQTGGQWQAIEVEGGIHDEVHHVEAVLDLIDALKTGREPQLSGRRALRATELIFATYESSRRRGRVDLPLEIEDSPYVAMLNAADITTWPAGDVLANGIRLRYHRTGDGSRPPVVLAHGYSDNGLCWTCVARALEQEYDVIMYDARGHGLSEAPETGYTDADRAADLAGLIQALGLRRPVVIGHSMGAATAAVAAAEYPDLIGKLVLEDPPWRADTQSQAVRAAHQAWIESERATLIQRKRLSRQALMEECRQQSPTWDEAELGPWAEAKRQLSPHVLNGLDAPRKPWPEVAGRITCPTLLITADVERGGIVTPQTAAEAARLNPRITVAHIADAGHNVRREAFAAYMAAVRAFLQDTDGQE